MRRILSTWSTMIFRNVSRTGTSPPTAIAVYSTLDLDLQQAAVDAVQEGMAQLDQQLRRRRGQEKGQVSFRKSRWSRSIHTPAMSGRWWAAAATTNSQLNHALAKRQPGSAFKPFVYATAINQSPEQRSRRSDHRRVRVLETSPQHLLSTTRSTSRPIFTTTITAK